MNKLNKLDVDVNLRTMGASWFVTYLYYGYFDRSLNNWKRISSVKTRLSVFKHSRRNHYFYLSQVLDMNENMLDCNEIGMKAEDIKKMSLKLMNEKKKYLIY